MAEGKRKRRLSALERQGHMFDLRQQRLSFAAIGSVAVGRIAPHSNRAKVSAASRAVSIPRL
jgi:hypothetical protein